MTEKTQGWEKTLKSRMPRSRVRRVWMVWAIWGMLGTSLTLEGTADLTGLTVAGWLTAPFWIAFLLWPFFRFARAFADRALWAEGTENVVHDPAGERPVSVTVIRGRRELRASLPALEAAFPGAASEIAALTKLPPDEKAGLPFETVTADTLVGFGRAWLEAHPAETGDVSDATLLALWADTFRHADRALRD